MEVALYTQNLSPEERVFFEARYASNRKDPTTGVLLSFFLGGFGAHRMYLGEWSTGVAYLLFSWTTIPFVIALVECFLMPGRVRHHNDQAAREAMLTIRTSRGEPSVYPSPGWTAPPAGAPALEQGSSPPAPGGPSSVYGTRPWLRPASPRPAAAAAPEGPDPIDQLERLADLRDRDLITDAEFAERKARILDRDG